MSTAIEFIKNGITVLGVPVALIAAGNAIRQLRDGNREKAMETRQRQAAAAQGQLKELFNSTMARDAMKMMDWYKRNYRVGSDTYTITSGDLILALGTVDLKFSPKEQYIRDCFEEFFDKIQIIAHLVKIEYLNFGDLAVPLAYYAGIIRDNPDTYSLFLDVYGYSLAKTFLNDTLKDS